MYLIGTDIPDEVTDAIYASISKMCCKRKGLNMLVDTDTMYILVVLRLCQQEKMQKKKSRQVTQQVRKNTQSRSKLHLRIKL